MDHPWIIHRLSGGSPSKGPFSYLSSFLGKGLFFSSSDRNLFFISSFDAKAMAPWQLISFSKATSKLTLSDFVIALCPCTDSTPSVANQKPTTALPGPHPMWHDIFYAYISHMFYAILGPTNGNI